MTPSTRRSRGPLPIRLEKRSQPNGAASANTVLTRAYLCASNDAKPQAVRGFTQLDQRQNQKQRPGLDQSRNKLCSPHLSPSVLFLLSLAIYGSGQAGDSASQRLESSHAKLSSKLHTSVMSHQKMAFLDGRQDFCGEISANSACSLAIPDSTLLCLVANFRVSVSLTPLSALIIAQARAHSVGGTANSWHCQE